MNGKREYDHCRVIPTCGGFRMTKSSYPLKDPHTVSNHQRKRRTRGCGVFENRFGLNLASDLGASLKGRAFFHAESLGFNVTLEEGLLLELAAVRGNRSFHLTVKLHLTGFDIALDVGVLGNGHLALVRNDLTVDFTINDHVV